MEHYVEYWAVTIRQGRREGGNWGILPWPHWPRPGDEDGEQDDISLDDNCDSIDISDESFEGDEDLECQYVYF